MFRKLNSLLAVGATAVTLFNYVCAGEDLFFAYITGIANCMLWFLCIAMDGD